MPTGSFVVVDLETNPGHSDILQHEIVEIGSVLVEDGGVVDRFECLVQPQRRFSAVEQRITRLGEPRSGDRNASGDRPCLRVLPLRDALAGLIEFCGDRPLVAHNGFGYDFPILDEAARREGLPPLSGDRLDTLDLAHLVAPRAGRDALPDNDGRQPPQSRRLGDLAFWLGLTGEPRQPHRALADAELTAGVTSELLHRMEEDAPHRACQRHLLAAGGHAWARWLSRPESSPPLEDCVPLPAADPASSRPAAADPESAEMLIQRVTGRRAVFDVTAAVKPLSEGGALVSGGGRSPRPVQLRMAEQVALALASPRCAAIEAPTGTGKTFAYLVPAAAYSRAARRPVVIATHTKVLQNELLMSIREYGSTVRPVRWVLLKGVSNYLSLGSLASAVSSDPADAEEALALAVVVGWAAQTPTGDWDDLRAWQLRGRVPAFDDLSRRLSLHESPSLFAQTGLDRRCFYRRARQGVEHAHVVVANHAVLVSHPDLVSDGGRVVIDEAHNLEEAATGALSQEVTAKDLDWILREIGDQRSRRGLLARYARAVRASDRRLARASPRVEYAGEAARKFGLTLVEYVRDRSPVKTETAAAFGVSHRLRPGLDTRQADFAPLRRRAHALAEALADLADALDQLSVPAEVRRSDSGRYLESEITRMACEARFAADVVNDVMSARGDEDWVNLVDLRFEPAAAAERAEQPEPAEPTRAAGAGSAAGVWTWGLRRVPVDVSRALGTLWQRAGSVVITSATLRVNGSFSHVIDRLGLGLRGVESFPLPTPFESIAGNELLVLLGHLPAPRGPLMSEFTAAAADEVARLLALTGGRALALYTSKARLSRACGHVRPLLEPRGVCVLRQGDDSAPALMERIRNEETTSLLATRSFWEGVDVPGAALSLLVIEKLPFASPADPVVAARMDRYERRGRDPFSEYVVPDAVLRFVQGVGRLIRTDDDRGVCVLLDRRLRRPVPYRDAFLGSLPGPPSISRPLSPRKAYEAIAGHLAIEFGDGLFDELASLPSSDPWHDIADLELSDRDVEDPDAVDGRLRQARGRLGFDAWRDGQLEVMRRFLRDRDTLAVLPTGRGKSLAYQLPALLRPGLTVVVSPLVALMRDQVESLQERGFTRAQAITSGQPQAVQDEILAQARAGAYKLLYVSPERLWSQRFLRGLAEVRVARIAVDEAHCISQWGYTFRPEYRTIRNAVERLTGGRRVPVLAVTATATPKVRDEIVGELDLDLSGGGLLSSHSDRPELLFYAEDCEPGLRDLKLLQIAECFKGRPSIVYVPRRVDAVRLAALMRAGNHTARAYHGAMKPAQRLHTEEAFRLGEIDMVIGTKAFGLGIDNPDVALVVHWEMPGSVEEYVQETGRAARAAGRTGVCVLLRTPGDCRIHKMFVESAAPDAGTIRRVWGRVEAGARAGREHFLPEELAPAAAVGDTSRGRSRALENRGISGADKSAARVAVAYLVELGCCRRGADAAWAGRVLIPENASTAFDEARRGGAGLGDDACRVARQLQSWRAGSHDFRMSEWSRRFRLPAPRLEDALCELDHRDVIGFTVRRTAYRLKPVSGARPGGPDLRRLERLADRRRQAVRDLSDRAKQYRDNDTRCRRRMMLEYLGVDSPPESCDGCDVCQPELPRPWRRSQITRDAMLEAIPARQVILALLEAVGRSGFSRNSIVCCLLGQAWRSDRQLSPRLLREPSFGALAALGRSGTNSAIACLIQEGVVVERRHRDDASGREWISLCLASDRR